MGVIIKHSIKNIFSKPVRLIILLICIAFTSFTALLALDIGNNIESIMRSYAMQMVGDIDIIATGTTDKTTEGLEEVASMKILGCTQFGQTEYIRDETNYNYCFEENISVESYSDYNLANELGILPDLLEIDDSTCAVTRGYADTFEVAEGDTITLETKDEETIELEINRIIDISNQIIDDNTVIVSSEIARRIACAPSVDYSIWLINVDDNAKVQETVDRIKSNDPKADITSIEELISTDGMEQIYYLFYLLFLISFLLVIFVTISFAEKIVNERMSVIGTLRSLGVSSTKTAFILLTENILYAVIGTVIGCFMYDGIKPILLGAMFTVQTNTGEKLDAAELLGKTPISLYLLVLLCSILVECAYPLYELLKAVKTPIRDIIFNTKDTEFKYKWSRLYTGAALLVVSIVTGFLVKNFFTMAISLAAGITSLAVLIPFLIKIISGGLSALFRKAKLPICQLAAENIARNKIIMGTALLSVTSIILSLLVSGVGNAILKNVSMPDYNADLLVSVYAFDEKTDYSFVENIESITSVDYIYDTYSNGTINGSDQLLLDVMADTEHTSFSDIPEEGYNLAEDEAVLSQGRASNLGINVGDEVEIVLDTDTDFPKTFTFTLADTVDTGDSALIGTGTIIINRDLYGRIFNNKLGTMLIKSDDPETAKDLLINNYMSGYVDVKTMNDVAEDMRSESSGIVTVLNAVIIGSVLLTLIGIAGNQTLGFVTRKRETALLYSVAMPRKRIKRLLFLESLFSIGITAVVAVISAPFLYNVLGHLLDLISDGDLNILEEGNIDAKTIFTYLAAIVFVYILTILTPIRYLRKMKISEELKYE